MVLPFHEQFLVAMGENLDSPYHFKTFKAKMSIRIAPVASRILSLRIDRTDTFDENFNTVHCMIGFGGPTRYCACIQECSALFLRCCRNLVKGAIQEVLVST